MIRIGNRTARRNNAPKNTRRKTAAFGLPRIAETIVLQHKFGISNNDINSLVQNILKEATKPSDFNIFNVVGITIDANTTTLLNNIDTHIKNKISNKNITVHS